MSFTKKSRLGISLLLALILVFVGAGSAFAGFESEPANNTASGAGVLTAGSPGGGFISSGDLDYWTFASSATGVKDVLVINQGSSGSVPFDVYIWDAATGNFVASYSNLAVSTSTHLYPSVEAGHSYYVLIGTNASGTHSGYNIAIY